MWVVAIRAGCMTIVHKHSCLVCVVRVAAVREGVALLGELGIHVGDGLLKIGSAIVARHATLRRCIYADGRLCGSTEHLRSAVCVVWLVTRKAGELCHGRVGAKASLGIDVVSG